MLRGLVLDKNETIYSLETQKGLLQFRLDQMTTERDLEQDVADHLRNENEQLREGLVQKRSEPGEPAIRPEQVAEPEPKEEVAASGDEGFRLGDGITTFGFQYNAQQKRSGRNGRQDALSNETSLEHSDEQQSADTESSLQEYCDNALGIGRRGPQSNYREAAKSADVIKPADPTETDFQPSSAEPQDFEAATTCPSDSERSDVSLTDLDDAAARAMEDPDTPVGKVLGEVEDDAEDEAVGTGLDVSVGLTSDPTVSGDD